MPSQEQTVAFRFDGGWATDFGTSSDAEIGAGLNSIPYLLDAENLKFEINGSPRKVGGLTKFNTTAAGSGAEVVGIYDFWRYAGGAAGTQKIVGHVGTVLYNFTGAANIATGLTDAAIPDYTTFDDFLIYASDADAPRSYDGSTDQAISGAPNFAFSVVHKNRIFAAGVAAAGSTLYWSVAEDPEDWTGFGSGAINVNPDDGDVITAIASFRGELWIFKGPHNRSIHRLLGSAPGSSDPFRLVPFAEGIGAAAQRLVFEYGNDLGFMDVDGTVHSLRDTDATASSYQSSSLSLPINGWLRQHIVSDRLKYGSAAVNRSAGYVLFNFSVDSATTNNIVLMMNYRFDRPRWSKLSAFNTIQCVATVVDPSLDDLPGIMVGGNDGIMRRFDRPPRSIDDDTAYTYQWRTPSLSIGDTFVRKAITAAAIGLTPQGNSEIEFAWKRDKNAWQTMGFEQTGGDVLAPTSSPNVFVLNQSKLGSGDAVDVRHSLDDGDTFHRVQFRATQGGLGEDAEIQHFAVRLKPSAYSVEN